MTEHDDKFESKVKELLDQSIENLDEKSLKRLHLARQESLQLARKKVFYQKPIYKTLGMGLAAACFVAVVSINIVMNSAAELDQNYLEDLELVAANEELDFFQELEFYDWLEESQDAG